VSSGSCFPSEQECRPAECHWRCAQSVIDELLACGTGVCGEEADLLLELRWALGAKDRVDEDPAETARSAEDALRLFCTLRLRMECRHYLAFFRIRRWLENHLFASVRICPAATPQLVPVRLNHYCVEAVRRSCLCAALGQGAPLLAPRLHFLFATGTPQQAESRQAAATLN
jgi:hypothetical protein